MTRYRRASALCLLVLLIGGCAPSSGDARPRNGEAPTPCEEVIPGCTAERLPDLTLTGDATDGALRPVTEPIGDVISFDEALGAAGREDGHPDAETVQVVLGSADAKALHWDSLCDSACDFFYGITWSGVCIQAIGPIGGPTGCATGDWGTVIDAHTGTFIVGGTG
jgi:hypothetical protein